MQEVHSCSISRVLVHTVNIVSWVIKLILQEVHCCSLSRELPLSLGQFMIINGRLVFLVTDNITSFWG